MGPCVGCPTDGTGEGRYKRVLPVQLQPQTVRCLLPAAYIRKVIPMLSLQVDDGVVPARPFVNASRPGLLSSVLVGLVLGWGLSGCGGSGSDPAAGVLTASKGLSTADADSAGSGSSLAVPEILRTHALSATSGLLPASSEQTIPATAVSDHAMSLDLKAVAAPDPGVLLMLVPDDQPMADPRISAWQDAASEEGVRLQAITDSQFLAMGTGAKAYAGLILPDSLHTQASDVLITALRAYAQDQGHLMLVFDFGALLPTGFYPATGPSRLSDLAGVQYVRYAELRDQTTGLGPVRALRQTMRSLLVPPGKSLPYVAPGSVQATAVSTVNVASPATAGAGLLGAAGVGSNTALYLPVHPGDPGGAKGFDPQQFMDLRLPAAASTALGLAKPRPVTVNFGKAFLGNRLANVSQLTLTAPVRAKLLSTAGGDTVDAYSGYLLGNLVYPVYATSGSFGGVGNPAQQVLADSPQFGLVAGVNPVGTGQVMFVNMPLTYLKGRTDALPMHGFLHYFVRNVLNLPHLSAMPNGVAGMTFDWHLDSKAAQAPTLSLMNKNVFKDPGALFSIEMTAGPDTIVAGDKLGWNLPTNFPAQWIMITFDNSGHSVGSHGGWIHDFYGENASESNQATSTGGACGKAPAADNFLQCLVLNRQSVDGFVGRPARGYSAPQGNNPTWAMNWLEAQGVVATYFTGHTGLGVTRQYRDGVLANPALWVSPVTPEGFYATFEEFQAYNVPKADVSRWYQDLIDFSIAQNTSRMVYAHPPGAELWYDVLSGLFSYAKTQRNAGQLAWYPMTRLADFMSTRLLVSWSQTRNAGTGVTVFNASHPVTLKEMVWRLPKSRYAQAPVLLSGAANIDASDPLYWQVKAQAGKALAFSAKSS